MSPQLCLDFKDVLEGQFPNIELVSEKLGGGVLRRTPVKHWQKLLELWLEAWVAISNCVFDSMFCSTTVVTNTFGKSSFSGK